MRIVEWRGWTVHIWYEHGSLRLSVTSPKGKTYVDFTYVAQVVASNVGAILWSKLHKAMPEPAQNVPLVTALPLWEYTSLDWDALMEAVS